MIRVVLVDDHPVVRTGYARLLEAAGGIVVAGEAGDAHSGEAICRRLQPDVLVTDLSMPGDPGHGGGLELIRRLHAELPTLRILVCSMHESPALVRRALAAGARGFVAKSSPPEALVDAVREVHAGRRAVHVATLDEAVHGADLQAGEHAEEARRLATLTEREHALFRLLAQGHPIADCARLLSLSAKTASNYQSLIRDKLGLASTAQLVHLALRHGLVAAPDDVLACPPLGAPAKGSTGSLS